MSIMTNHPTNAEVKELAALIDRVNQPQLDFLVKRVRKRIATIAEEKQLEALAHAKIGRKVRLHGLKPKYMNDQVGEIVDIFRDTGKIRVRVITPTQRQLNRFGRSGEITVPAGCCTVQVD